MSEKEDSDNTANDDLESMVKRAQQQPGITELMELLNKSGELKKLSNWYLDMTTTRPMSVSSNTSE